jgi:sulfoxide reductase heme-binding subunit YedZ
MKLSPRLTISLLALVSIGILVATDQILPASSAYQAQMRIWLAARATGIVALVLLSTTVVLGILLSHPEQARWKKAKGIFPWHESLWVFVFAFLLVHVVSLVVDEYAGVGIGGALVPGMSSYRSVPVALGVLSLYALLITAMTARYTKLLPAGVWLRLHRLSVVVLGLAWMHGVLAGTDSDALRPLYWAIGISVLAAASYRYWLVRERARRARSVAAALQTVPIRAPNTPELEEVHV